MEGNDWGAKAYREGGCSGGGGGEGSGKLNLALIVCNTALHRTCITGFECVRRVASPQSSFLRNEYVSVTRMLNAICARVEEVLAMPAVRFVGNQWTSFGGLAT